MTDVAPLIPPGVVYSLKAPADLSDSIARALAHAMTLIPADKNAALVAVATEKGGNLVLAARTDDGTVQAQAWIGKSGWNGPIRKGLEVGAQIAWVF